MGVALCVWAGLVEMAFILRLFQSQKKQRDYPNIKSGVDPLETWRKVGELGDGAFGKVFKAEEVETGRLAALKRVPIGDETELDDFMVEIDILAECKHRRIVNLYEAFYFDSALWIFIEFCPGGAVDDIIVELEHGLSEPQIQCICRQLFEALAFLHEKGCIHRDLKAGNILLCADGSIRLADFGVSAKAIKGKQRRDTFIGTPYWMAPEVVVCETCKDCPYNSTVDVWSAGITLIELGDMNPPYNEMNPMRVLLKITKSPPPKLIDPRQWTKGFQDFVAQCLVKDPASRPTAADLLQHPFISSVGADYKPLIELLREANAEVVELVEDLSEDALIEKENEFNRCEISLSPVDTCLGPEPTTVEHPEALPQAVGPLPTVVKDNTEDNPQGPEPVALVSDDESTGQAAVKRSPSSTGSEVSRDSSTGAKAGRRREEEREAEAPAGDYRYATLSRVRKFEVDGRVMQTTTKRIVEVKSNQTLKDSRKLQQMRKADSHEMKRLQREEMKEAVVFYDKIKAEREVQERKIEIELQELEKRYMGEHEQLAKRQRKGMDRMEQSHVQLYKAKVRELKSNQSKEGKRHKEKLKEMEKEALKQVESSVPKEGRKKAMSRTKSDVQLKKQEEDKKFQAYQSERFDDEMKKLIEVQKEEMKDLELEGLEDAHNIKRNRENELWEMEQRHKQEQHQLLKQQIREAFHMQRHQMQIRQQKEVELQQRRDQFRIEDLRQKQLLESRQLPKHLKAEHKQQVAEARKAYKSKRSDAEKEVLRGLDEQYVKRCKVELGQMKDRHNQAMDTLKMELDSNIRELKDLQNERRMALTQQETNKIKERDEQHTQELREWRNELKRRKERLEDVCRQELDQKASHYDSLPLLAHHQRLAKSRSLSGPNSMTNLSMDGASRNSLSLDAVGELSATSPTN